MGLTDYAGLQKGEDVAVVGVSGGVGGAVAQLARALGARRILGIDRRPPASGSPAASRIDAYLPIDGEMGERFERSRSSASMGRPTVVVGASRGSKMTLSRPGKRSRL
jgi:NADPH:quinone reductase